MIVEIVSTGTELLLGEIVNTNAPYLAKKLNQLGFSVLYQTTIGDNRDRMADVFNTALDRADIVITSGGSGDLHRVILPKKYRLKSCNGHCSYTKQRLNG